MRIVTASIRGRGSAVRADLARIIRNVRDAPDIGLRCLREAAVGCLGPPDGPGHQPVVLRLADDN